MPFAAGRAWKGALAVGNTSDVPTVGDDTGATAPTDTAALPVALAYVAALAVAGV
jgi:hypothetical protein